MNINYANNLSIFDGREQKIIGFISDKLYDLLQKEIKQEYLKKNIIEEDVKELYNDIDEKYDIEEDIADISEIVNLYNIVYKYFCDMTNKIADKMGNIEKIDCEIGLIKDIDTKIETSNNVFELVSIIVESIEKTISKIKELESIIDIEIYTFEETLRKVKDKFI